ncbi:Histidine kinase-, DNA gyrase B-, and HSP90-like ATPase [Micromonospora haikouensis]|uniref:histidine kinase n=1 Tax=Micromonospora haikouensis TaxID=686309 RepID=A0A1C4WT96_9ACTN|nr:hypothetical protein [Micromonospora haikouensis]SCE99389.1 Histidine kinase-, DNA gyrase B-, and HSP90-like ATPase [Micromonospora haikouensis]
MTDTTGALGVGLFGLGWLALVGYATPARGGNRILRGRRGADQRRPAQRGATGHGDHRLRVTIVDDGYGGADERAGSGLSGIRRRAEAHDGKLTLTSPPGGPTTVEVDLPCGS